jgi:hypothetical protein
MRSVGFALILRVTTGKIEKGDTLKVRKQSGTLKKRET